MITVSNDSKAKKLCTNSLRFGRAIKVAEKYWKAGTRLICIRYYRIEHKRLSNYSDRPEKCLLYAGSHQTSNHQCGIDEWSKKLGKLCMHVIAQSANCMGKHQANFAHCTAGQNVELQAQKRKTCKDFKILKKGNNLQLQEDKWDEYADVSSSHKMDIQAEVWSKSLIEENLTKLTCERRD